VNHFQTGNLTTLEDLLLLQSGSIGNMRQFYWVQDVNDWKMTRDLTLNMGVRWEYYGPPWEGRGLLPTPVGSNLAGAFGISGDGWDDLWQSNPTTKGKPTVMEHVGPGSPNPGRSIPMPGWPTLGLPTRA
jgi:hypothetical protein